MTSTLSLTGSNLRTYDTILGHPIVGEVVEGGNARLPVGLQVGVSSLGGVRWRLPLPPPPWPGEFM